MGDTAKPIGQGRQRISWRRNLYALWAAQLLAIVGFSMRTPFLPFFLGDLGIDSIEKVRQLLGGHFSQ